MGLGSYGDGSGISAALFFARRGANLLITDLRKEKELEKQLKKLDKFYSLGQIEYVLDKHRKKDFEKADLVFKNPGVPKSSPYLKIARENKIPIINDWTIFFEERPNNLLIGITGTKGKSTTATLIYEILKNVDKDVVLCGNIGKSPLAILNKIKPAEPACPVGRRDKEGTIVVAELSSWLLREFKTIRKPACRIGRSPQIAVVTNLMPEHLDKYKSLREYYGDKENIFKFQKKDDWLILNKDDAEVKKFAKKAKAKIIWFSEKEGRYAAAVAVARLLGIPEKTIEQTLKNFKGVSHRLELVCEKRGVKYINDSAATMPEATIYALSSLEQHKGKIILIAGGVDKKLDYKSFVKEAKKSVKAMILLPGTATDKILKENTRNLATHMASDMKDAVAQAKSLARKGDVVLLSPGAASFNMFKNEFDRGNQFVKEVKKHLKQRRV